MGIATPLSRARADAATTLDGSALFDVVEGLGAPEDFRRRLDEAEADGFRGRLVVLFALDGFDAYERRYGSADADRLLTRLGRRLADSVGVTGDAFRVERDRFAMVARPGRVGPRPLVRAAAAALTDVESDVEVVAVPSVVDAEGVEPATALLEPPAGVAEAEARTAPSVQAARDRGTVSRNPPPGRMPYLTVATRFWVSVGCGLLWLALSAFLSWPWIDQLAGDITLPVALAIITGLALIPGYLNVQMATSLAMDHPARIDFEFDYPGLTVLVAAYNEQRNIAQTIAYTLEQDYGGTLRVIVTDDGSADDTVAIARGFARFDDRLRVVQGDHGGKAVALNHGMALVTTPLVATIDADTLLMPDALQRVVSRMLLSPENTMAVAGSVLVRNSRANLLTGMQNWDYFLGIGSIKRQQALLQGTLVAQGAFSVYDSDALRSIGGWPDCIGEDIVMTWALLALGGRTTFEPTAVAFTETPVTLRHLVRQRRRWARGMIEGLRAHGRTLLAQPVLYRHSVGANLLFPYLDLVFTFAFIPGIVLALLGNFAIVGPMTLAVLPLNGLLALLMYRRQRKSLVDVDLHVRRHFGGFIAYFLLYQLIMSPVSVAGYVEELLHRARRW